jgi:hypothetical protein
VSRFLTLLLLPCLAGTALTQEIRSTVSNTLRYGNGTLGFGMMRRNFSYFENLTDVRIALPEHLVVGGRLLFDDPPEVGPEFTGVKRRWLEFERDQVALRAGNFSELFGRGLALNLFENRGLAYDTWMDGIRLSYTEGPFKVTVLGGRIDFYDSVTVARTEVYKVRGANIELQPLKGVTVGGSFISADGNIPRVLTPADLHAELPDLYCSVHVGKLDLFTEWTRKWTNIPVDHRTALGYGVYSSASMSGKGWGGVLDYKDYRFDIRDPFERFDTGRATRMLPFQNPPIVRKEQSWTLLSRQLQAVDFNDEVGLQFEGFVNPVNDVSITLNASLSSQHAYFLWQSRTFTFERRDRSADWLPSLDDALSPYVEGLLEVDVFGEDLTEVKGGIAWRRSTQAIPISGTGLNHIIRSIVVPAMAQIGLNEMLALTVESEHEWVNDNYKPANEKFYNQLTSVTLSFAPHLTVAARFEFTTDHTEEGGRTTWAAAEIGYRIGESHTVLVTAGQERGGLTCSNGVCRLVQPFAGVRCTIQSQL